MTLSMVDIIVQVSTGIHVRAAHREEKRVPPCAAGRSSRRPTPLIHILSGKPAPPDAYAATHYRDTISGSTTGTSPPSVSSFLMLLFSLAETASPPRRPS